MEEYGSKLRRSAKPENQKFWLTVLLVFLVFPQFFVSQAIASSTVNTLHYDCKANANYFSVNSLDFQKDAEELQEGEGLFVNSSEKDKGEANLPVAECVVAGRKLNLSRVFLNIPDNSGNLCATLDWAVFQLKVEGELVSEFISGCSEEIHLFTTKFNLHVCKSDFNRTTCKSVLWREIEKEGFVPVRIGLLGNWL